MNYGMGPNSGFGPQFGGQFRGPFGYTAPMGFGPAACAAPGFVQPGYMPTPYWGGGYGFAPPTNPWMGPAPMGWGFGGMPTWGGTYSPQNMSTGLPTDPEIVEMIYDTMDDDPLIPFDADINIDSDAGTVTLTGTVHSKLVKHAAGDDAWWIPGVDDVHNELRVVAPQRRQMGMRARGAETREQAPTPTPLPTRAGAPAAGTRPTATGTTAGTGTRARATSAGAKGTTGAARTTTGEKPATGTTGRAGTRSTSGARGRSSST